MDLFYGISNQIKGPQLSKNFDVVIVGAGISGLLSALALSKEGKNVVLIEKDNYVGGVCRTYDVDGYRVDTGPHIITRLDSGPLKILMDRYFDVVPKFVPIGKYYVRMNGKVKPFPWSIREWMTFDLLPIEDRSLMMKTAFDLMYMLSAGRDLSEVTIDEVIPSNLSKTTIAFLDYLSYFMLGTSTANAPVARFLDRKEYKLDRANEKSSISIPYVGRLYNLLIGGRPNDQMYPRGGIQRIVDSIIVSLPKNVEVKLSEEVVSIDVEGVRDGGQKAQEVERVTTDRDEYECSTLIYSGSPHDLPGLTGGNLPVDYVENLRNVEQVDSLTVWLGLDGETFTQPGSEMWVSTDPSYHHTWLIPTSNYDPHLAPKGKQLVGFAFIVPKDVDPEEMRRRAMNTIFTTMPELEGRVEMVHYQELVPEKACWSINSGFGDVETPVDNLYCVGSSTIKRSMGLTRSAYSVLRMLDLMKLDGNQK